MDNALLLSRLLSVMRMGLMMMKGRYELACSQATPSKWWPFFCIPTAGRAVSGHGMAHGRISRELWPVSVAGQRLSYSGSFSCR